MTYLKENWAQLVAAFFAGAVFAFFLSGPAFAADLGGNCCTDLEERIAELEATTARKGNRKVSLAVYGQVNAGLLWVDVGDTDDTRVVQNGTDETFIGFAGQGRINADMSAGYVLELDVRQLGLGELDGVAGVGVRQSYWYLKSEQAGKLSIGKQGQATNDWDKTTLANLDAVAKPLSGGAFSDEYLTGLDAPFDGTHRNVIRYTSPKWSGFTASASWGNSLDATEPDGDGDAWDASLRYAGEFSGVAVEGMAGYRFSTDLHVNLVHLITLPVPTGDVKTLLAAGSVMHMTSGLFVNGYWADQDWETAGFKLTGWQGQGGVETRLNSLGKTTFYGEYGRISIEPDGEEKTDIDLYGGGVVQAIDGAALDLYAGYRVFQTGDVFGDDIQTGTIGARMRF